MNYMNNKLLFDSPPVVVDPKAAIILGMEGAAVLQQLHYWLTKSANHRDGKAWVYNTLEGWQKLSFPWMSTTSISRRFKELEKRGLVITGNYNKTKMDKTIWYTIDYEKIAELEKEMSEKSIFQNEKSNVQIEKSIPQFETTIPETTTETTHKDNTCDLASQDHALDGKNKNHHQLCKTITDEIKDKFNSILVDLPKVIFVEDKRIKLIRGRWRDLAKSNDIDQKDINAMLNAFDCLFKYIHKSDFLNGRNGNKTSFGFDWIFKQENFIKILEGNYENKGAAA